MPVIMVPPLYWVSVINNGFKVHWFTGTTPFTYNFPVSFDTIGTNKIVASASDGAGGCVWLQDKTLTSVKVNYWNVNNESASKIVGCIGLGF